jgi:hypothetical protein
MVAYRSSNETVYWNTGTQEPRVCIDVAENQETIFTFLAKIDGDFAPSSQTYAGLGTLAL